MKVVLITGGSRGIGQAIVREFAAAGYQVAFTYAQNREAADRLTTELAEQKQRAVGYQADVRDFARAQEVVKEAQEALGPIDVLINNAGIEAGAKTYMMIDEDDWDSVIDTNLKSAWLMSKLFTERLVANGRKGGNIINVSSITDTRTIKGQFPYAVSKGGLTRMTEILALEAPRYGVRVNALAPGYILTDVSRLLLESDAAPEFMKGIPMRRFGEFDDLDGPLLLLASDASSYMNGSIVVVDGGHICASL